MVRFYFFILGWSLFSENYFRCDRTEIPRSPKSNCNLIRRDGASWSWYGTPWFPCSHFPGPGRKYFGAPDKGSSLRMLFIALCRNYNISLYIQIFCIRKCPNWCLHIYWDPYFGRCGINLQKKMPFENSLYINILSNLYIPSFLLAGDRHYDKSSVGTNGFTPCLLFRHLVNFPTQPDFGGRQFQMQSRRHHANLCMRCYLLRWFLACCVCSFSGAVVLWKGDCGRAGENRIVVCYQPWYFTIVLAE